MHAPHPPERICLWCSGARRPLRSTRRLWVQRADAAAHPGRDGVVGMTVRVGAVTFHRPGRTEAGAWAPGESAAGRRTGHQRVSLAQSPQTGACGFVTAPLGVTEPTPASRRGPGGRAQPWPVPQAGVRKPPCRPLSGGGRTSRKVSGTGGAAPVRGRWPRRPLVSRSPEPPPRDIGLAWALIPGQRVCRNRFHCGASSTDTSLREALPRGSFPGETTARPPGAPAPRPPNPQPPDPNGNSIIRSCPAAWGPVTARRVVGRRGLEGPLSASPPPRASEWGVGEKGGHSLGEPYR